MARVDRTSLPSSRTYSSTYTLVVLTLVGSMGYCRINFSAACGGQSWWGERSISNMDQYDVCVCALCVMLTHVGTYTVCEHLLLLYREELE